MIVAFFAVFGGLGTIWGPAVGAVLLYVINEALRFVGVVYNLIVGGVGHHDVRDLSPRRPGGLRAAPTRTAGSAQGPQELSLGGRVRLDRRIAVPPAPRLRSPGDGPSIDRKKVSAGRTKPWR